MVLFLLVDCTIKRAGEGYDTQTSHPSCDPMLWRKSWFSYCHVFCVTCVFGCHVSPGANVSNRPGVTWTEPAQANSALPQSSATIPPQGVHQGGVGVLKTHNLAHYPRAPPPSLGPHVSPSPAMGPHSDKESKTLFDDAKQVFCKPRLCQSVQ